MEGRWYNFFVLRAAPSAGIPFAKANGTFAGSALKPTRRAIPVGPTNAGITP
jgi:hypothetical protein